MKRTNLKVKMPKVTKHPQNNSMWKELLMTFIGTTLSIVLTFGTSQCIEDRQQEKAGRQMAMMVIHDIDNSVEAFRALANTEEQYFQMAQYVMNHIETIDSISRDTLSDVLTYLTSTGDDQYSLDDSSEKIFLSSQEVWKNIDNATFIDVVQDFYYTRHNTFQYINSDKIWRCPIDEAEVLALLPSSQYLIIDYPKFLREALKRENVRLYISFSPNRKRNYNQVADKFQSFSDQCKFIMGITDEELKEYVENLDRTGRPLKERDLPGHWIAQSTSDQYVEFEFKDNDSIVLKQVVHLSDSHYTGNVDFGCTYTGTWQLQGDSLITMLDHRFELSMDTTSISYLPEMQESVKYLIDQWYQSYLNFQKQAEKGGLQRHAYFASVDASGKKIELAWTTEDENGKENKKKYYLSREE